MITSSIGWTGHNLQQLYIVIPHYYNDPVIISNFILGAYLQRCIILAYFIS